MKIIRLQKTAKGFYRITWDNGQSRYLNLTRKQSLKIRKELTP